MLDHAKTMFKVKFKVKALEQYTENALENNCYVHHFSTATGYNFETSQNTRHRCILVSSVNVSETYFHFISLIKNRYLNSFNVIPSFLLVLWKCSLFT